MAKFPCRYFCEPAELVDNTALPDHLYRRYAKLLKTSYEYSGTQYGPLVLNNAALADLWHLREDAARATLAEMKELHLIDTKQIGQRCRQIRLLVAWRGSGTDSAPEPAVDDGHNAPDPRALHLEAQATAPQAAAPSDGRAPGQTADAAQGANAIRTLAPAPNTATAVFYFPEIEFKNRTAVAVINSVLTRTREEKFRIQEALDDLGLVDDEAHDELLALRNVTPEYAEDWLMSYILAGKGRDGERKLSPGYYRQQMRERRTPPYRMSMSQRRDYREQKDFEWEQHVTEDRMEHAL